MRCELCDTYRNSERVEEKTKIAKNKEMTVVNRYCPHRENIVNADDDGCEKFSPTKFFWCDGWNSWVSPVVCQARQKKDKYGSCPCSIGNEVMLLDLSPKIVKKKLIIRKPKKQLVIRKRAA